MVLKDNVTPGYVQPDITPDDVRNQMKFVALSACMGTPMVPIFLMLVLFSTPAMRRQPYFWIQCVTFVIAFANVFVNIQEAFTMANGTDLLSREMFTTMCGYLIPWLCDLVLLFKILAFYPRPYYSHTKRLAVIAFPALLKLRIVYAPLIAWKSMQVNDDGAYYVAGLIDAEFVLLPIDALYCSAFLLYRSHQLIKKVKARGRYESMSEGAKRRLHATFLMQSILLSFLPAFITQVLQAGFWFASVNATDANAYVYGASTYLFNIVVYMTPVWSLLASCWSTIRETHLQRDYDDSNAATSSTAYSDAVDEKQRSPHGIGVEKGADQGKRDGGVLFGRAFGPIREGGDGIWRRQRAAESQIRWRSTQLGAPQDSLLSHMLEPMEELRTDVYEPPAESAGSQPSRPSSGSGSSESDNKEVREQ